MNIEMQMEEYLAIVFPLNDEVAQPDESIDISLPLEFDETLTKESMNPDFPFNVQEIITKECTASDHLLKFDETRIKENMALDLTLNLKKILNKQCVTTDLSLRLDEAQTKENLTADFQLVQEMLTNECISTDLSLKFDETQRKEGVVLNLPPNIQNLPTRECGTSNFSLNGEGYDPQPVENNGSETCPLCIYPNLNNASIFKPDENIVQSQQISGNLIYDYVTSGRKGRKAKSSNRKSPVITAVPNELKDSNYHRKRQKNNESAKKCREMKRIKEQQLTGRVIQLESENIRLKNQVTALRKEMENLRAMVSKPCELQRL